MYSKHVLWMGGLDQSERSHKEELHSRLGNLHYTDMLIAAVIAVRVVKQTSSDTQRTWQECSVSTFELTKKQQVQLLDRHDAP